MAKAEERTSEWTWIGEGQTLESAPAGTTLATKDHGVIQKWAEKRNAKPATIEGTGREGRVSVLRLDFPGYTGTPPLKHISWDDWFQPFDERDLTFIFQNRTADGKDSNFFKVVRGEGEAEE